MKNPPNHEAFLPALARSFIHSCLCSHSELEDASTKYSEVVKQHTVHMSKDRDEMRAVFHQVLSIHSFLFSFNPWLDFDLNFNISFHVKSEKLNRELLSELHRLKDMYAVDEYAKARQQQAQSQLREVSCSVFVDLKDLIHELFICCLIRLQLEDKLTQTLTQTLPPTPFSPKVSFARVY